MDISLNEAILRLFLAMLLGSVVGLEREYTQQPAGLRTHILVCLGATVFTLVSISTFGSSVSIYDGSMEGLRTVRDPGRIMAQIVAGIGFIGGGAVLRHGASIRGLTTAASLWMMASIGMLVGIGEYQLSLVATVFSFLVLFIIGGWERTLFKKHLKKYTRLRIQVTSREEHLDDMQSWLQGNFPQKTVEMKTNRDESMHTVSMTYVIDLRGFSADVNELSRSLNSMKWVLSASVKVFHEEKI